MVAFDPQFSLANLLGYSGKLKNIYKYENNSHLWHFILDKNCSLQYIIINTLGGIIDSNISLDYELRGLQRRFGHRMTYDNGHTMLTVVSIFIHFRNITDA